MFENFENKEIKDVKFRCSPVLPEVYDDSISYYEVLNKVMAKLNEVVDATNETTDRQEQLEDKVDKFTEDITKQFGDLKDSQTALSQKVDEFTEHITSEFNKLSESQDALTEKVDDFIDTVEGEVADVNKRMDEFIAQVTNIYETYENEINQKITDLTSEWNQYKSEIDKTLEDRKKEWEEYKSGLNQEWKDYKDGLNQEWDTYKENTDSDLSAYKDGLNQEWNTYKEESDKEFEQFKTDTHAELANLSGDIAQVSADVDEFKTETGEKFAEVEGRISNTENELNNKVDKSEVVQTTGQSTTNVMSQKAVTDALAGKQASGDYVTQTEADETYATKTEVNDKLSIYGGKMLGEIQGNIRALHFNTVVASPTNPTNFIKININSREPYMLAFTVRLYANYSYFDIVISGYNYQQNFWYRPNATCIGASDNQNLVVYFGHSDVNELWFCLPNYRFLGLDIFNVTSGYHDTKITSDLFTYELVDAVPETIDATINPSTPQKQLTDALRGKQDVGDYATNSALSSGLSGKIDKTAVVQSTGTSTTNVMSQKAVTDALAGKQASGDYVTQTEADETYATKTEVASGLSGKVDKTAVVQSTGTSTTNVMSQKAVTDALAGKQASGDYVTQTEADETYATKTELTQGLAEKQDKGDYATNSALSSGLNGKVDKTAIVQSTGTSTTNVMSQKAVTDELAKKQASGDYVTNSVLTSELNGKVDKTAIVQSTGMSTTDVMSQKAVTDALSEKQGVGDYVTQSEADSTYATKTEIASGLETKQDKGDYATRSELSEGLAGKQDVGDYATNSDLTDGLNSKVDKSSIVQTTGESTSDIMSQKAVTDGLNHKAQSIVTNQQIPSTENSGFYMYENDISYDPNIAFSGVSIVLRGRYNDGTTGYATDLIIPFTHGLNLGVWYRHQILQTWQPPIRLAEVPDMEAKLAGKQDVGDYATRTELTQGLAGKQNLGDYATKSSVDALSTALAETQRSVNEKYSMIITSSITVFKWNSGVYNTFDYTVPANAIYFIYTLATQNGFTLAEGSFGGTMNNESTLERANCIIPLYDTNGKSLGQMAVRYSNGRISITTWGDTSAISGLTAAGLQLSISYTFLA